MVFDFILFINSVVMLISLSSALPSPVPLVTGISKFELLESTRQDVEDSKYGSSFIADDSDFVLTNSSATTKPATAPTKNVLKTKTSDPSEDLLMWKAPLFFQKNVLYYHVGHNDDGMPVWVVKVGKIPLRKLAELDEYGLQVFDKYVEQMTLRIFKSIQAQNTTDKEVTEAVAVLDCDGLGNYEGVISKEVLLLARIFISYRDLIINQLGKCVIINANHLMQVVLTIVRPVFGAAFEKIEVYGKNPTKLKSVLHPRIPKNSIPAAWYGSYTDSKPLSIY